MTNWPRITIVTPSFNQAAYLERTIVSVLDQGYPNLEYIVMDGGSTDGSADIIHRYADRLAYWRRGPDDGQAGAIADGFARGTGEILAWVNSDDLLLPGALEAVGRFFAEHGEEECVTGWSMMIDAAGQPMRSRVGLPSCLCGGQSSFRSLLLHGCTFCQPSAFWRACVYRAVGGLDRSLQFSFDYDLFLRLARRRRLANLKRFLSCFRLHDASKTSTLQDTRRQEDEIIHERYGRGKVGAAASAVLRAWYRWRFTLRCRTAMIGQLLGTIHPPLAWVKSNELAVVGPARSLEC
jgi:glycosyltransferase involved in cell wall biosynthesis